jgi:hypothetical protein
MIAKHTIGNHTFGFSEAGIRARYGKKADFIRDTVKAHPDVDEPKLKKILETVWSDIFPDREKTDNGGRGVE